MPADHPRVFRSILIPVALSASLMSSASTGSAQSWPNEPNGSTLLVDDPFNQYAAAPWRCHHSGRGGIAQDPDAPLSGPNVLRYRFPVGQVNGGTSPDSCEVTFPGRDQIFMGYWFKTSAAFEQGGAAGTKLSFIASPSFFQDFIPNLTSHLGSLGGSGGFPIAFYFPNTQRVNNCQVNQQHQGDCPGTVNIFPKQWCEQNNCQPIAQVKKNTWYRTETYLKKSSCRTCADGIMRFWLTEKGGSPVLLLNVTNMNWVEEGFGLVHINTTWGGPFNQTYGSTGSGVEGALYYDHWRISFPNCPGGCPLTNPGTGTPPPPPPPTTPPPPPPPVAARPGAVTDLTVSQVSSGGATLQFTQVSDGAGAAAKYIVRVSSSGALWGGAPDLTQGTCATPLQGSAPSGPMSCTVTGLIPSTRYEFQMIAFRGTMNVDAVFGELSNVASAATATPQASTDVNGDGSTTIVDVQLAINQSLGLASCSSADVNADGRCNVTDVQKIVNAALGG